jgi:hypothetical protein
MSYEKSRVRPKRSSLEVEEARAWVGFYQRVGSDPAVAAEVMAQLEADPEMKRAHLALYLCCKQSLRTHKANAARNKRIAQFVRWMAHGLVIVPAQALSKAMRQGRDIAVECMPEVAREPALPQVKRLRKEAEFAQAQSSFDAQAVQRPNAAAAAPVEHTTSTAPKAAPKTA